MHPRRKGPGWDTVAGEMQDECPHPPTSGEEAARRGLQTASGWLTSHKRAGPDLVFKFLGSGHPLQSDRDAAGQGLFHPQC